MARSLSRTKYCRTKYVEAATPAMFRAKNASLIPLGISAALLVRCGSRIDDPAISAAKAKNQGSARRGPTKTRAPSGEVNAQMATALEATKPPRLHCRRNGSNRDAMSCAVRKNSHRFVLAKWIRLPTTTTW
jgi:hypothetical protein